MFDGGGTGIWWDGDGMGLGVAADWGVGVSSVCVCVWTCLDCGGREGVREERDEEGDGTGDPRRTGRWDFDLRLRLHLDLDWAGALGDLDLGVSAGVFARGGRQLCT